MSESGWDGLPARFLALLGMTTKGIGIGNALRVREYCSGWGVSGFVRPRGGAFRGVGETGTMMHGFIDGLETGAKPAARGCEVGGRYAVCVSGMGWE